MSAGFMAQVKDEDGEPGGTISVIAVSYVSLRGTCSRPVVEQRGICMAGGEAACSLSLSFAPLFVVLFAFLCL